MSCTGCKRRSNLNANASREEWAAAGWFIWRAGAPARFTGVLLCPACRLRAENTDAFGQRWPTAELEELASGSGARSDDTKGAGGSEP